MKEYINKIICADSLEIMKKLPDNSVDLILTDPPYGINIAKGTQLGGIVKAKNTQHIQSDWDEKIPEEEYFKEIFRISKNQIIWGGNYFITNLKNSRCWIVWDKDNGDNDFADCELARTSFNSSVRLKKHKWQGMLQASMKYKEKHYHPTQKPKELFKWCLENYSKPGDIILDCFGGSGTTGVAAIECGRKYIVIEKESKYCEIAERRARNTTPPLFTF